MEMLCSSHRLFNTSNESMKEEFPGIEWWASEVVISDERRDATGRFAIATANLVRVNTKVCGDEDYVFLLDNLTRDLGEIADDIDESWDVLGNLAIGRGMDSTWVAVDTVFVNEYWRGRGLGPATVLRAAEVLQVDAIFLCPGSLTTVKDEDGVWRSHYGRTVLRRTADRRVRRAWKNAGSSHLRGRTWWNEDFRQRGPAAQRRIDELVELMPHPQVQHWWLGEQTTSEA